MMTSDGGRQGLRPAASRPVKRSQVASEGSKLVAKGLIIGTRGSDLALWQARHIQALLGGEAAGVKLQIIKTLGDQLLDISLQNQIDKGFFTKELEAALLAGHIDLAVHSLKDLPTENPPGLVLAAVPPRADCGDVLFVRPERCDPQRAFPVQPGATVGTASLRRSALLACYAPQAQAAFLRGNVPTRLGKAKSGDLDAVVLARAGVARLGLDLGDLLAFDLHPQVWLPAAGQGALGIQCRHGDAALLAQLAQLADPASAQAVAIEREVLQRMEGGCHSPFGALAVIDAATVTAPARGTVTVHAGAIDAANRWLTVQVQGPAPTIAAQAERALRQILRGDAGDRSSSPPAEFAWALPARPWS